MRLLDMAGVYQMRTCPQRLAGTLICVKANLRHHAQGKSSAQLMRVIVNSKSNVHSYGWIRLL